MSVHKKILLPTDLTEASDLAAERARALIDLTGAELIILYVVEYVPPPYVAVELPEGLSSEAALVERAKGYLSDWANKVQLADHQQIVEAGSPKRIIVDTARENDVDLIVMSTHGEKGLARIIGSTASGVLHNAPCDVFVVHISS